MEMDNIRWSLAYSPSRPEWRGLATRRDLRDGRQERTAISAGIDTRLAIAARRDAALPAFRAITCLDAIADETYPPPHHKPRSADDDA